MLATLLTTLAIAGAPPLTVTSPAFTNGEAIPQANTCDAGGQGFDVSISGVPATAQSLVVIVHDPDAPGKNGFTHWVVYNAPASTTSLSPQRLPPGAMQGENDKQQTGYTPPCPPTGRHHYVTTVYALDETLPNLKSPDRQSVLQAMTGHVVASGQLIGTYARSVKR